MPPEKDAQKLSSRVPDSLGAAELFDKYATAEQKEHDAKRRENLSENVPKFALTEAGKLGAPENKENRKRGI